MKDSQQDCSKPKEAADNIRNAVIIGAGSVGLGLGSCLAVAGVRVTFVGRPAICDALSRNGLVRTGIFGTVTTPPSEFAVCDNLSHVDFSNAKVILVCTKSFDSATVAAELVEQQSFASSTVPVVLCQNGWGNFERFAERLDPPRIYNARVITGFRRNALHEVEITVHAAPITLGSLVGAANDRVAWLADALTAGGIPAVLTDAIERDLWAKLLYNCCLNPLGAVLESTYGKLADNGATREIMDAIAAEAFAVMSAGGWRTHWSDVGGFLDAFYGQMVPVTYSHESSMLQDVRAGRRTEIEALNGAVVRLGREHGVPTPVNSTLLGLMEFKSHKRGQNYFSNKSF
jgi:2-dehydropantoate 2-reductase